MAEDKDRQKKVNQTYTMASNALREKFPNEFNMLRIAAAKSLGIKWEPKLSPEQKAEKDLDALLAEFPHLRQKFEPEPGAPDDDTPPDPAA